MFRRISTVAVIVFCVVGSLFTSGAIAADERRAVALLYTPPCPFLLEMEGELRAAGFLPILMAEEPGEEHPLSPAEAAGRVDAFAAVRILPSGEGVTVFAVDAVRRVHLSTEVANADAGAQSGRVAAIKTVELLRVALMETETAEASPPPPPAPEKPAERSAVDDAMPRRREWARLLASAAPAVTYGFGGVPPALHVNVSFSVRPVRRIRLFVSGLVPTFAGTVEGEGGSVAVKEGFVVLGMDAELSDGRRRVTPFLGLRGGAAIVRATGTSEAESSQGRTPTAVAGTVQMHLGAALRLSPRTALVGDVAFGAVFPEPVIRVNGREVASFGRPILTGSLGLEVRLF